MSMLAEPRRKQKWTLNPRGKDWSEDSNKFGQKMLEKMGWSSGKGLGAKEQGMTEHVRVKFKDDQGGIGYNKNNQDKQWTQHEDGFNDLLMTLQKSQNLEPTELMETKEISLSGTSLELKSKQSRARVHYQKFTRGKDVNRYSSKDLANIFGKKTLDEKTVPEEKKEEEEFHAEPVGTEDHTAGVVTIKGGNMADYFKNKMSSTLKQNLEDNEDDSESERYVGFGFNTSNSDKCDNNSQNAQDYTNYAFENPCLDLTNVSPIIKPPRKRKSVGFINEGLDLNQTDNSQTPKKVKTNIAETADCFVNPALNLDAPETETRNNGAEFEVSRLDDLSGESAKKKKKKRKKDVESSSFINPALNLECPDTEEVNGTEFEVPRVQMGLDNDALDLSDENSGKKRVTFNDCVEYNTDIVKKKKKAKTKLDKFEIDTAKVKRKKKRTSTEEVSMVFVNPALEVETFSEEMQDNELNERKCRKEKRKKNRRMSNLETIEEAPEENENQDVIRDLEVITVNDSIENPDEICEDETPKKNKKKKKKENVEMIEIENTPEKSLNEDNLQSEEVVDLTKKKKKKKDKDKKEKVLGTNNEFDKENENEKDKKKKKKRKSSETCEFFLDIVDDNYQVQEEIVEEISESKKSKKKRLRDVEIEEQPENKIPESCLTPSKKPRLENEEITEVTKSPHETMTQKSKKVFKTIFAKSAAVHFKGSNIHDIKGYGID